MSSAAQTSGHSGQSGRAGGNPCLLRCRNVSSQAARVRCSPSLSGKTCEQQDVVQVVHAGIGTLSRDLGTGVQLLGDLVVHVQHRHVTSRAELHSVEVDPVGERLDERERAGFGVPELEGNREERLAPVRQLHLTTLGGRHDPDACDRHPFGQTTSEALPPDLKPFGDLSERVVDRHVDHRVDVA